MQFSKSQDINGQPIELKTELQQRFATKRRSLAFLENVKHRSSQLIALSQAG